MLIELTDSDDVFEETLSGDNTIIAFAGNDIVTVTAQSDGPGEPLNATIYGGAGEDSLSVAEGGNGTLYGDDGDDILSLDFGEGSLYGGAGNDYIDAGVAGRGYGGDGDDYLTAGFFTSVDGGDGNDTLPTIVRGSEYAAA